MTSAEYLAWAQEFDDLVDAIYLYALPSADAAIRALESLVDELIEAAQGAPPEGTNAYFDALTARGDCLLHYSLRDPAQLAGIVNLGNHAYPRVTYDAVMDAARIVIDPDANSLKTQARWSIPDTRNVPVMYTWDCWWDSSFLPAAHNLANYKTWQIASKKDGGGLALEINNRFDKAENIPIPGAISTTAARLYGKNAMGPNVVDEQPLLPQAGDFTIWPDRWTRYWVRLLPWIVGDVPWWAFSMWLADEQTDAVQVFNDLIIRPVDNAGLPLPYWKAFWIEFNTSTAPNGTRPPLVAYARNWAAVQTDSLPMERPRR